MNDAFNLKTWKLLKLQVELNGFPIVFYKPVSNRAITNSWYRVIEPSLTVGVNTRFTNDFYYITVDDKMSFSPTIFTIEP